MPFISKENEARSWVNETACLAICQSRLNHIIGQAPHTRTLGARHVFPEKPTRNEGTSESCAAADGDQRGPSLRKVSTTSENACEGRRRLG